MGEGNMNKKKLEVVKSFVAGQILIYRNELEVWFNEIYPKRTKDKHFKKFLDEIIRKEIIYEYDDNKYKPCGERKKYVFNTELCEFVEHPIKLSKTGLVAIWNLHELTEKYAIRPKAKNIILLEVLEDKRQYLFDKINGNIYLMCPDYKYYLVKRHENLPMIVFRTLEDEKYVVPKKLKKTCPLYDDVFYTVITTPRIEKVLVDVMTDEVINIMIGISKWDIVKGVLKDYQVNIRLLIDYAKLKGVEDEVEKFLINIRYRATVGEFAAIPN